MVLVTGLNWSDLRLWESLRESRALNQCAQQHTHTTCSYMSCGDSTCSLTSGIQRTTNQRARIRLKQVTTSSLVLSCFHLTKTQECWKILCIGTNSSRSYLKKKKTQNQTKTKTKQGDLQTLICTGLVY